MPSVTTASCTAEKGVVRFKSLRVLFFIDGAIFFWEMGGLAGLVVLVLLDSKCLL
jgi:hypothetical protein